jgi:hypothetical protein
MFSLPTQSRLTFLENQISIESVMDNMFCFTYEPYRYWTAETDMN